MTKIISLTYDPLEIIECSQSLLKETQKGNWVKLSHPREETEIDVKSLNLLSQGPGIIIASSGSTGGRHYCFQPCSHINQSAFATGQWLKEEGINPNKCKIFNPLPLNHVSGLMPWWRSRHWEVEHEWISPSLMRNPAELVNSISIKSRDDTNLILSLVPTQLKRLLQDRSSIEWLKSFTVIWVGGSFLPDKLAEISRKKGIRLSPCYGTTETMAMVAALSPNNFLQGESGVGRPLEDIELRLNDNKALQIRTSRLGTAIWKKGKLLDLKDKNGWWSSGDLAEIISNSKGKTLRIKGRFDNAIHSGGETIFPEKLQEQLFNRAINIQMPIKSILLAPIDDEEWGNRLIALVRLHQDYSEINAKEIFIQLKEIVNAWLPAEKPYKWYHCPHLEKDILGKWDLDKWVTWAKTKEPIF